MSAAKLYRKVVPHLVREPLWLARTALWRRLTSQDDRKWRGPVAELRVCMGRPIAQVRVEGVRLNVDLRDTGVGRPLYVEHSYEPLETDFIERSLKPGMVFVDIGANIGYYSTIAARRVGSTGRVLAIEPDPHNFHLLSQNISTNRLRSIQAVSMALGDNPGVAKLFRSTVNYGDHRLYSSSDQSREGATIKVTTLDDLVSEINLPPIDVIKMDVQGYESKVVAGMKKTLARNRRLTVLTEFWPFGITSAGGSPAGFFATFERAGFSAFTLTSRGRGTRISYHDALTLLPPFDERQPDASYINILFQSEH